MDTLIITYLLFGALGGRVRALAGSGKNFKKYKNGWGFGI